MSIWMWLSGISAVQLRALTDKNKELRKELELAAERLDFAAYCVESWDAGEDQEAVDRIKKYALQARKAAKE